jgi:hypothetical protein
MRGTLLMARLIIYLKNVTLLFSAINYVLEKQQAWKSHTSMVILFQRKQLVPYQKS